MASSVNLGRALRWILSGLLLALSVAILNVTVTLAFLSNPGFGLDATTRASIALVSVAISIAAPVVGGLGLRPLYDRMSEVGNGRSFAVQSALWSALAAGACAGTFLGTGLLLGLFRLVGDAYLLADATHAVAGFLFVLTAGLFLLLALRQSGSSDTSFLAGAALALAVLSAVVAALRFDVGVGPSLIGLASLVLWVLAYVGTIYFIGPRTANGAQPVAHG